MKKYTVKNPIIAEGKVLPIGTVLELDPESPSTKRLLADGHIAPAVKLEKEEPKK